MLICFSNERRSRRVRRTTLNNLHFVLIEKGRKWSTNYAKCTRANQFHYRYNVWEVRRLYTKGYVLPPLKKHQEDRLTGRRLEIW